MAQSSFWYFGDNAGLNFQGSNVFSINDGEMHAVEGCITATNRDGQLLFYSNGEVLWNSQHDTMFNGADLLGSESSTQSSLAFPNSDQSQWLLVTLNGISINGTVNYSLIDMALDGGLGGVVSTQKNIPIDSGQLAEKLSGVVGTGNSDGSYWFVYHTIQPDTLKICRIDPGLNVIAHNALETGQSSVDQVGYSRFSQNGEYYAFIHRVDFIYTLTAYRFNSELGALSSQISVPLDLMDCYGLEFSPNSRFLYITGALPIAGQPRTVLQLSFEEFDEQSIESSMITIGSQSNNIFANGAIALGPDRKIYKSSWENSIQIINEPNAEGVNCNWDTIGLSLGSNQALRGLPNSVSGMLFYQIFYQNRCQYDSMKFNVYPNYYDSIDWNFGDIASGSANLSSSNSPIHVFSDTGEFLVKAIVFDTLFVDTVELMVRVLPIPEAQLGNDTVICIGSEAVWEMDISLVDFLWSTGSDSNAILVNDSGWYRVTVSNSCGLVIDSVYVQMDDTLSFWLGRDTALCESDTIGIDIFLHARQSFVWSTGDTMNLTVEAGSFLSTDLEPILIWLAAQNACGSHRDSIYISFYALPKVDLPSDTVNCFNQHFMVSHPSDQGVNYMWGDSSVSLSYLITSSDEVRLFAYNQCGSDADTMRVLFYPEIEVELGADTAICQGDSVRLIASWPSSNYSWSTGATDSIITVHKEDNYVVTITNGPCILVEQRQVTWEAEACDSTTCKFEVSNVFTPNGDGINDGLRVANQCADLNFELSIFNRWGQLVFASQALHKTSWDGYSNGAAVSSGTYFLLIEYMLNDERKILKSSVELMR